MNQKSKLTFGKIFERFAYGCGDFGCNIIYTAMSAFLLFYYTDYAGVSAMAVGTIMMISRIFDGISDIVMGVIVDRTHSRFGKARPWILRMCIPFAISGVLMFSVPASWTSTPKLVYVFITYNLVSTIIYTAINVPYSALNALMTQDPYERSVLSIFRNLLATAGTLTINTFTLPLVEYFGNNASAWTKTFVIFGFVSVAAFLCTFFGTKERVRATETGEQKVEKNVPFVTGIKALFQNKYWIMMTGMLALFFLMYSVNGGATVYYAKDILGDKNLVSTINGIFNVVQILAMFFIAMLVKKYGKRNMSLAGACLALVGQLIFCLNPTNFGFMVFSCVIRGLGLAPLNSIVFGFLGDVVEFGQWKNHIRQESLIFAGSSVGMKVGAGLTSAIITGLLSISGYISSTSGAIEQPDSAIRMIINVYRFAPLVVWVSVIITLSLYKLDKMYPMIMKELTEREAKGVL